MSDNTADLSEIFSSIQGEGPYIGEKQLFIRFAKCNLNCSYCDTDYYAKDKFAIHSPDGTEKLLDNPCAAADLIAIVKNFYQHYHHSISLTGGEPLMDYEFLKDFLPALKSEIPTKIYLETNGIMWFELEQIIDLVDIISMDIKLKSATGQENTFLDNIKFIKTAVKYEKEIFVKIVVDNNYDKEEILKVIDIISPYNLPLIIQPANYKDRTKILEGKALEDMFAYTADLYPNTRLIPQVHKYMNLM
ncbi:MAG: 7-carboxy-7-deazaguanine synthase QueE [Candidatus Gastranaerophilales bacterium]|nr:7-carboxy-7-deazaguanine synthase QueE [Candidatus Gastranaerophilales bacterium]